MISIIVPVYNVEKYLETCINSILSQTYTDFELILIDDGSTDNSGVICDKYEEADVRVRVIHNNNQGVSATRNTGIEVARGDYIAFIDSDDLIHPDYLLHMFELIEQYNADLVCCSTNYGNVPDWNSGNLDITVRYGEDILEKMYINDGNITITTNKLYKKSLFIDNNIRFIEGIRFEDIQIMPRILNNAKIMVITNNNLYFYRKREGSFTKLHSFNKSRLDIIKVVEDRMEFLRDLNKKHLFYIELDGYIRKLIRYRAKMDKYNYTNELDIDEIEQKLGVTIKKYLFDFNLNLKIKIKGILAILKYKIK